MTDARSREPEDLHGTEERLEQAAREAYAREKHRTAPRGEWTDRLWFPSPEERQPCCDTVAPPTVENRQALENHCRSQAHIASLFGVSLTALRRRVRELRREEEAAEAAQSMTPEDLRKVRTFVRSSAASPSDRLFEASAQGRLDALREIKQEGRRFQNVLSDLLAAEADAGLERLLDNALETHQRLGVAMEYALRMERTSQVAQEVRELVARLYSTSERKQTA